MMNGGGFGAQRGGIMGGGPGAGGGGMAEVFGTMPSFMGEEIRLYVDSEHSLVYIFLITTVT